MRLCMRHSTTSISKLKSGLAVYTSLYIDIDDWCDGCLVFHTYRYTYK